MSMDIGALQDSYIDIGALQATEASGTPFSGSINLFIHGHQSFNNNINLFTTSFGSINNNINLFISAVATITNDIELFIGQVPQEISGSLNLFIAGQDSVVNDIDLFLEGPAVVRTNIKLDITQISSITSSGTQDISIDGFGDVKAAIIIVGNAIVDGTAVSGTSYGVGITDGSTTRSIGISSQDNVGTSNTQSIAGNYLIYLPDQNTNTVIAAASFDSLITDGIRINWITPPPDNYLITAIFFGGTDLEAVVSTFTSPTNVGQSTDIDIGFEPDQLVCISNSFDFSLDDIVEGQADLSIGFADNNSDISQGVVTYRSAGTSSIGSPSCVIYSGIIASRITLSSILNSVHISGFNASGFTASTSISNGSTSIAFLALKYDGRKHAVSIIDTPTTTGVASFEDIGFRPLGVLQILTQLSGINTLKEFNNAGAHGLSIITDDKAFCHSLSERSTTITDNQTLFDNKAINFPNQSGSTSFVAETDSFSSSGWLLDFSSTESISRKWLAFTVENPSGPTSGSCDLFINGQGSQSYWNLFLKTPDNDVNNDIDLIIYGSPSGETFDFIAQDLNLFIENDQADPPQINILTSLFLKASGSNSSDNNYWSLFLSSSPRFNDSVDLFISTNNSLTNNSIDLFIARIPDFPGEEGFIPINYSNGLFLKVKPGANNNIDLFMSGSGIIISGSMDLFVEGQLGKTKNIALSIRGVSGVIDSDMDLSINGIGDTQSNQKLFMRGC
jgi:hypothetical protein